MADPVPPPVVIVEKKRRLGCFGCGCLILLAIVALGFAVVVGSGYYVYVATRGLTAAQSSPVATFDGGDAMLTEAQQKVADFRLALQQHKPAALHLKADEINTLLARDPGWAWGRNRAFVSIDNNEMKIQVSVPLSSFENFIFTDRYLNGTGTVVPGFDPDAKELSLTVHDLQLSGKDFRDDSVAQINQTLSSELNGKLKENSGIRDLLNRTQKIEIDNNELVIEME